MSKSNIITTKLDDVGFTSKVVEALNYTIIAEDTKVYRKSFGLIILCVLIILAIKKFIYLARVKVEKQ